MEKRRILQKMTWFMFCFGVISLCGSSYNKLFSQQSNDHEIKVALVYTVTTPELKADVEREIKEQLGCNVKLLEYEAPEVFEEIRNIGYVTAGPSAKLIKVYMQAIEDGADAILSICSTVADIGYSMQDAAKYIGVPIVLINDGMCREAIRKGRRIAIMATFPTAIDPTRRTIQRISEEMGKQVEVVDVLMDGAFGLDQAQFKALMATKAGEIADKVDVIIFAQGSMAYCEEYIAKMYNKVVLSNPRFGAEALREVLISKELM